MSASSVYQLWLTLQCQMIAGCSQGMLVKQTAGGQVRVLARWPDHSPLSKPLSMAAQQVVVMGRMHMQKDERQGVYFAHPIVINKQAWGAIVLHLDDKSPQQVQATIRLLKWGFTWLQVVNATALSDQANSSVDTVQPEARVYQHLLEFISTINKESNFDAVAIATVNQLARTFKFDRVSLGLLKQNKLQLQAISYNAQFDKRSEEAQRLCHVMQEAYEQNANIAVPSTPASDQVRLQHTNLLKQHGLHYCATYLLKDGERTVGALLLEKQQSLTPSPGRDQALELYIGAASDIISLRSTLKATPKLKAKSFSVSRFLANRKHLERLLLGLLVAVAGLSLIPANYTIKGDAVLQSNSRHLLVAPFDGFLARVLVEPGQLISQGDLLAQLKDEDLVLERRKLASQLQQLNLEYDTALAAADRAQAAIVNTRLDQVRVQQDLAEERLARTALIAPIDGVIVSDDIRQSIGAPVTQGKVLFEIAKAKDFDVHIFISENDIAQISAQQLGELILTSLPGEIFNLKVKKITPISEINNGNNYFRVEAELATNSEILRPGMRGSGRIEIGQRRLGWIWFHDIWHWLRRTLWL